MLRLRFILLVLLSPLTASAAEAPKIDRLYPAGGQQGTSVNVELGGKPGEDDLQSWSSHGQLQIAIADDRKFATITIPEESHPGVHWLRFYNSSGISNPKPFFVGHIAEMVEEESNDHPDQADPISDPAVTINGVLSQVGDVDVYRIQVPAGRTLVASMQAGRELGSPMDSVLQLLDDHGTVVAQNDDDHGVDPQIAYKSTEDTTFYVRTFAFPASPNRTVKLAGAANYVYRLTVTHGPFIDHVLPAIVDHRSNSAVTVCGWNLTDRQRTAGITAFDDHHIRFGRDFALTHLVPGVARSSQLESDVSRALAVNSSISGRISVPGERDVYILPGVKDQRLNLSVQARAFDSLLDPLLTITAEDNSVVSETDDSGSGKYDAETLITVPSTGPLLVSIEDRFQDGGFRYFYTVTCVEPTPEFTATVGANQYVSDKDEPIEVPVTINRTNGFSEQLTISFERLPDGVTTEPVISEKDGDSAKAVTLKLHRKHNAPAFSGAVQILCRAADTGDRRFAAAAIQNSQARTSDIWLTVIPKSEPDPE